MLPHNHFLIAAAVIAPAGMLSPDRSPREIADWVLIGGMLSAAIDLDVVALVLLRSRKYPSLRPFRSIVGIYRHFGRFMDVIAETGVLRMAMGTHVSLSVLLVAGCALLFPSFLLPLSLAVLSHIVSDIPNIKRALMR